MADSQPDQFRIDPLVVFKLGEELISGETQALLELIKNAYDADASFARVAIHTSGTPKGLLIEPDEKNQGWIEVTDDGIGMTPETIRDGWLLIAKSGKREFKEAGMVTEKNRTPLGDKGLGRLGTQRLGWALQIATKTPDSDKERVLAFSWEDFLTAATLDQVAIKSTMRPTERQQGTVLTITQLQEPDRWAGERITQLQEELSEVISPYEGVSDFTVAVSVDGAPVDLQSLGRRVRETAQLHYDIDFKDEKLAVAGRATLGLFRPAGGKRMQEYQKLVEADDGAAFFEHLLAADAEKKVGLRRGRGRWFVTFKLVRRLADLSPALDDEGSPVNPGPFRAEVDSFSLGTGDETTAAVFGSLNQYRKFIKDLAGIRVYRDGFVVRTDADWLGLGSQWTSATSYYGLKPDTTLGYVAVSSRNNAQLVEKTDREGFVDNAAYRNFHALMGDFREFTEEVQELLRREYLAFAKANAEAEAELDEASNPEDVSDAIDETLQEAEELQESVAAAQATVSRALEDTGTPTDDSSESHEAGERTAGILREAVAGAQETLTQLSDFLTRIEVAQSRNRVLREELAQMRAQLDAGVEAMSLGLTAEALSHEMFMIADGLAARTQGIATALNDGTLTNGKVRRFVQYIRGSVGALRKELAHFSPSMRYVRERRERVDVAEVVGEVAEYYRRRWQQHNIDLTLIDNSRSPFMVRVNRGRLTQILDNLLLNSEYWIGVAQKQRAIQAGEVTIELGNPHLTVTDNGPGVETSVESSLFDAFVTRKPRGTGRGLGLFIVRQLLDSEDCTIELGPGRNEQGRRREFVVNLAGMLDDS
jgi:signal transduction histidine kinase